MIKKINEKDYEYFQQTVNRMEMPECESDICEWIGANFSETLGFFEKDTVIAMIETKKTKLGLEVSLIFTLPSYRNKQVGKRLIDFIKKECKYDIIYAHPYTDEAEKFFVSNDFELSLEFDQNDENTVIFRKVSQK